MKFDWRPRIGSLAVLFLLCAAALVALVPAASAHAAADPMPWETRVLHDNVDDHGGHGLATTSTGHELHALDIQEVFNATLSQDVLLFRLVFDGGWGTLDTDQETLRDVITFKLDGAAQEFEFTTDDNDVFSSTFDAHHVEPELKLDGTQDGERRVLVGMLERETRGIVEGAALTEFEVKSFAGDTEGDTMGATDVDSADDSVYQAAEYLVKGPVDYVSMTVSPSPMNLTAGVNGTIFIDLDNLLKAQDQEITLVATVPDGVAFDLHVGSYQPNPFVFELTKGEKTQVHLFLNASAPMEESIFLGVSSSAGGRIVTELPLNVVGAASDDDGADDDDDAGGDEDDAKDDDHGDDNGAGNVSEADDHDHGDHDHGGNGTGDEAIPGPGIMMAIAAVGAAAVGLRRRR